MKDLWIITLAALALYAFWLVVSTVTHYQERMAEYNRHLCVDVYAKSERCD